MSVPSQTPVLLIGGGGHCAAVIDVIESTDTFKVAGIVEAEGVNATEFMGYPIVGHDSDLDTLLKTTPHCLITVGQTGSGECRQSLYHKVKQAGGQLITLISPFAYVSKQATLESGTVVMHQAMVNTGAKVGNNCIINSGALIEHDSIIGAHSHVSTHAVINGGCSVEQACFIGSNATLIHGIKIKAVCTVGAGAVVTRDLLQAGIYVGIPAVSKGSPS